MFAWSKSECIVLPLALATIFVISTCLGVFLRKYELKTRTIPLMVITVVMLILEIIKQVLEISTGDYGWYTFPMHFCSLFLYFYPLACFAKGKVQSFGKTMSFVCSMLMFLLFYFNPSSIIGSGTTENIFADFGTFHTFIYHHLVMLFLFSSIALRFYNFTKWSLLHVVIGFSIYAIIAVPCAHLMNANFCNLLVSNIEFMESLRLSVGQIIYTFIMYLISIIGGLALVSIPLLINKISIKKKGETK